MSPSVSPEVAAKRQVSESSFLFLHAQMVEYNLRGYGGRMYDNGVVGETGPSDAVVESAKRRRLEALGHDVGKRLAERHLHYREKLENDLDKVKFLCKDFWEATFGKQVDVLRTNHRGLYVLTDNNFRWLALVAPPTASGGPGTDGGGDGQVASKKDEEEKETSVSNVGNEGVPDDFAVFPCGVICGALTRMGLRCRVSADLAPTEPGYRVSFNVQLIQS